MQSVDDVVELGVVMAAVREQHWSVCRYDTPLAVQDSLLHADPSAPVFSSLAQGVNVPVVDQHWMAFPAFQEQQTSCKKHLLVIIIINYIKVVMVTSGGFHKTLFTIISFIFRF